MVAQRSSSTVTRTALGTIRSPRSGRTWQAITGHVVALLTDLFALALAVAVGAEVKGITFRLAVKTCPAGKT